MVSRCVDVSVVCWLLCAVMLLFVPAGGCVYLRCSSLLIMVVVCMCVVASGLCWLLCCVALRV